MSIPAVIGLVALPRLAAELGPERLGVLTLVWATISYLSFLHLGVGRAFTQSAAGAHPSSDEDPVAAIFWTGFGVVGSAGVAAAAVLFVASGVAVDTLRIPPALRGEAVLAFRVLATVLPFLVSTPVLTGVLEARHRFAWINAVSIPASVVVYLGPLVALHFGGGLVAVVAVIAAARLAAWLVTFLLCFREIPTLRRWTPPSRREVVPLLRFGGWSTVSAMASPLMVYMDRFVVGSLVSTAAVAYYAAPQEVVLRLGALSGAVAAVLFPTFAAARNEGAERATALLSRGVDAVFLLVVPPAVALAAFSGEALRAWLGHEYAAPGAPVLAWLALGLLVNGFAKVPSTFVQGVGRPDLAARLHLIEVPLYLVCLGTLVAARGIEGAAIAWVLRATVDMVALFWVARPLLPGAGGVGRRVFAMVCGGALMVWGGSALPGVQARLAVVAVALAAAVWVGHGSVRRPALEQLRMQR